MTANLKSLLLELSIPLLLVFAINVAFARWIESEPTLPLPRIFPSEIQTGKYLAFLRAVRAGEPIDILYTGMSQMMTVDAAAIDASVARAGKTSRGFNLAAPVQGPYFVPPFVERIVAPFSETSLVVHGLMPLDVVLEPRSSTAAISNLLALPVFSLHVDGFRGVLWESLSTRVPLIQYRELIVDWLWARSLGPPDPWSEFARTTNPWGAVGLRPEAPVVGLLWYEKDYQERFKRFHLALREAAVFAHTVELARWCEDHGIDLVLVNSPVHPLFFEMLPGGQDDYTKFVEKLRRTAGAVGVPLFDPLGTSAAPGEFFRDTHHLNQAGAAWFNALLIEFLREQDLPRRRGGAAAGQRAS